MPRRRFLFAEYECPCCGGIWLIQDFTDGSPTADDVAAFHRVCQDCRPTLSKRYAHSRYNVPRFVAQHMVWV